MAFLVAFVVGVAACDASAVVPVTATASRVTSTLTTSPTPVVIETPVTLPAGRTIDLHVSSEAILASGAPNAYRASGENCDGPLLQFTIPLAPARADDEIRRCTFSERFEQSRYSFLRVPDGSYYLRGVELLVWGKASLPMPYVYSDCASIRAHLFSANEDPKSAAHILTCYQAPPLPNELTGRQDRIWTALPASVRQEGLGRALRNFCWYEASLLGAPSDVQIAPSPCELQ